VFAYADALALVDRVDGVLVVCDPRGVHRSQLVRLRELITGAGGTVLGTVMHRGQQGKAEQEQKDQKGQKGKRGRQRGSAESAVGVPAAGNGVGAASQPSAGRRHGERPPGAEEADLGDGSSTIALRAVVPPDRSDHP
jgi:hypothetical protein